MKKLALDFDGTIANTNIVKSALIHEKFGVTIPPWQCDHTLCVPQIGEEAYREISSVVFEEESTLATPPLEGAVGIIQKLAEEFELYLVTARPERRLAYARQWLKNHHLEQCFQKLISSRLPDGGFILKLQICQENQLDLLIDDDSRHLTVLGYENILRLLMKDGYESGLDLPKEVIIIKNWSMFYDFCVENFNNPDF
ncbi:hypothetical protein JW964_08260 [candidate division KSB1 bacterium]|nr:hypothetical protein [candidate division KSB1 bacterium]